MSFSPTRPRRARTVFPVILSSLVATAGTQRLLVRMNKIKGKVAGYCIGRSGQFQNAICRDYFLNFRGSTWPLAYFRKCMHL